MVLQLYWWINFIDHSFLVKIYIFLKPVLFNKFGEHKTKSFTTSGQWQWGLLIYPINIGSWIIVYSAKMLFIQPFFNWINSYSATNVTCIFLKLITNYWTVKVLWIVPSDVVFFFTLSEKARNSKLIAIFSKETGDSCKILSFDNSIQIWFFPGALSTICARPTGLGWV